MSYISGLYSSLCYSEEDATRHWTDLRDDGRLQLVLKPRHVDRAIHSTNEYAGTYATKIFRLVEAKPLCAKS